MIGRGLAHCFVLVVAMCSIFGVTLSAQQDPQEPTEVPRPKTETDAQPAVHGKLVRWLELQNATLNLRYRFVDTTEGVTTTNQLQHRESLRARVKFDSRGRYSLNFGVFTGVRFTSGWDNTGWGINVAQKNLAFKALYLDVRPITEIEVEVGGLYIVRGKSTEVTTYDEDGYIMGERLTVRRPSALFFDEITFTNAYFVSDPRMISVGDRFRHIDEPNYQHFLLQKNLGERGGISADYTVETGARTWRQAVALNVRELRFLDSIIFENYQRTNRTPAYGFAVTMRRMVHPRVALDTGYASIDRDYGGLNADRFNIGRRAFAMATYTISPEFLASMFITTPIGRNGPLPQRTLMNLVFTYNALPALKRTGLF